MIFPNFIKKKELYSFHVLFDRSNSMPIWPVKINTITATGISEIIGWFRKMATPSINRIKPKNWNWIGKRDPFLKLNMFMFLFNGPCCSNHPIAFFLCLGVFTVKKNFLQWFYFNDHSTVEKSKASQIVWTESKVLHTIRMSGTWRWDNPMSIQVLA